jgi:hypothetical protein
MVYYLRYIILHIIYFLVVVDEKDLILKKLTPCIEKLILVQIPVIFIKLIIFGFSESGAIGTLSTEEGSISAIFPLYIISYLIVHYFYTRDKKYIYLILSFIAFGLIGTKRAIVFLVPTLLLLAFIIYSFHTLLIKKNVFSIIRNFLILLFMAPFIFYLTVRLSPSLNPEDSYWGSFNLSYVINYTEQYTGHGKLREGDIPRSQEIPYFVDYLSNTNKIFTGDGAGKLVTSGLSSNYNAALYYKNPMMNFYNIFYGGRMGIIWILLQTGILGVILYVFPYYFLYKKVNKIDFSPLKFGFILGNIVFLFDFLFYSKSFIYYQFFCGLHFYIGALLLRGRKKEFLLLDKHRWRLAKK